MKRRFSVVLVVAAAVALLSVGSTQAQIFTEPFEGIPVDTSITGLGWTLQEVKFPPELNDMWTNATLVDTGQSARQDQDGIAGTNPVSPFGGDEYRSAVTKSIVPAHYLSYDEPLVLEYVIKLADTWHHPGNPTILGYESSCGVSVRDSGMEPNQQWRWGFGIVCGHSTTTYPNYFQMPYGVFGTGGGDSAQKPLPAEIVPGSILDIRVEIEPINTRSYWRLHKDTPPLDPWTPAFDEVSGHPESQPPESHPIDQVRVSISNKSSHIYLDSINVSIGDPIPAPSSILGKVVYSDYGGDITYTYTHVELLDDLGASLNPRLRSEGAGPTPFPFYFEPNPGAPTDYLLKLEATMSKTQIIPLTLGPTDGLMDLGTITMIGGDVSGDNEITTGDASVVLKNKD